MLDSLGNVLRSKLIEVGFNNDEISLMINNNILGDYNNKYKIIDIDLFNVFTLRKVLEFERNILTLSELDYLGISDYNKERLISYGIGTLLSDGRIKVTGDINKLLSKRDEIDISIYKKLYIENLNNDNIKAREYLEKYIDLCINFDIEGSYYYELFNINNKIVEDSISYEIIKKYNELKNDYKRFSDSFKLYKSMFTATNLNKLVSTSYTLFILAKSKFNLKDYKSAIKYFKRAIKEDNYNVDAYKLLGRAYLVSDDYKSALESTKEYIKLDRNTKCDAYLQLFIIYLRLNDINNAYDVYNYAISVIPKHKLSKFIDGAKSKCKQKIFSLKESEKPDTKQIDKLSELLSTITKEVYFDYNEYKEEKLNRKTDFSIKIEELLQPDENNSIDLRKIDEYIKTADVDLESKNLMFLEASLILARNNYMDKSLIYLRQVEHSKNKSSELKNKICDVEKKIKILKHRF